MVPGEGCCVEFVSPMSRPFAADSTVSCFAMVAAFLQNYYVVLYKGQEAAEIVIIQPELLPRPGTASAARVVPVVRAAS